MDLPKVTAHGRSDVGRVRSGNEDALFVGRTLFAVADGMGGHRAGEVASAAALGPLGPLDGRNFADSDAALTALTEAVTAANAEVSRQAKDDPDLEGMGTTLTAVHVDGRDAHVVHVGDSRAYLARGDRLVQLTDDHTLVQALIDQGRITRDDIATHPHRSVITRAIGVAPDVEVDAAHVTLHDGDRIVLCSDGLTGVVDDATIARTVRDLAPAPAVDALIDAANAAGGPDNITVVIVAIDGGHDPDATAPLPAIIRIRTDDLAGEGSSWLGSPRMTSGVIVPAGRGRTGSRGGRPAPGRERLLGGTFDRVALKLVVAVVTAVLLLTGIGLGARVILDRAYLVGVAEDEIVIYRGFDVQLGPFDLKRVHERPGITLDQVQPALRPVYVAGRPAADLGDARRIVRNIPLVAPSTSEAAG
jgi:serine/threonine protein phosphatase PrpC